MTSTVFRATHWAKKAQAGAVHVYEVEPLDQIEPHRVGFADDGGFIIYECRAGRARIIREVDVAYAPPPAASRTQEVHKKKAGNNGAS